MAARIGARGRRVNLRSISFLCLFAVTCLLGVMALSSGEPLHPDERSHVEAMLYFESHWLPPKPGTADLYYSTYGRSRVYSGEITPVLMGKVGALAVACGLKRPGRVRFYRAVNLCAFVLLMAICVYPKRKNSRGWVIALGLLCLPQVLYLFTYVNTDSLSLVVTTLFLLYVIGMTERFPWHRFTYIKLGILIVLVGLGRINHWVVFLPAGGALLLSLWERSRPELRTALANLSLTVMLAAIPIIAWRLEMPRMLGANHVVMDNIADLQARRGFRPSNPFQLTLSLREKGVDASALAPQWMRLTIESSYARFGRFLDHVGSRMECIYGVARWLFLAAVLGSTLMLILQRKRHPLWLKTFCCLVPIGYLCIVAASLKHSMDTDWQPQGRYLFGLLPATLLLLGVPLTGQRPLVRLLVTITIACALALSIVTYVYMMREMLV